MLNNNSMKKVRWKITVILVAAALCGCVNDPTENGVAEGS